MRLTPRETDKLMLHYAGTVAKGRLEQGDSIILPGGDCLYIYESAGTGKRGKKCITTDAGG